MKTQAIFALSATLISGASARFSANYNVWTTPMTAASATLPPWILVTRVGCTSHGTGKIAIARFHCSASGDQQNFAGIEIKDNDIVTYCREHFCTCMKANFEGIEHPDGGTKLVHFNLNDDHAWNCSP